MTVTEAGNRMACKSEADPRTWEAKGGAKVLLRPIRPDDFVLERDFVRGLSLSASYMRLMSGRHPSLDEIRRWTDIDRQYEEALIATVSVDGMEGQVGVARYAAEPGANEAECAVVVTDVWQRKGLGTQLLAGLIESAKRAGMKRLFGTTLSENRAMLGLAARLGFKPVIDMRLGYVTELTIDLAISPVACGKDSARTVRAPMLAGINLNQAASTIPGAVQ